MTQCTQSSFPFEAHFGRAVVANFDGGTLTSDAGALLLRQVDRRLGLLRRLTGCFRDFRTPWLTRHSVGEMVAQRVYGLALGYEDLNDHDQLRCDPLMAVLAGQAQAEQKLAGKSTLCRLERTPAIGAVCDRYRKIRYDAAAIDRLLLDLFVESQPRPPRRLVLDLDVTDTPLHGRQEGRFFHGFYDEYCYLPLYVFCGDQLLAVRLREANQDASAGSLPEIERIVTRLRGRWPRVQIILRADSGFCREELMRWCEDHQVDYVFGLARNQRLRGRITKALRRAQAASARTGRSARVYTEFRYRTRATWSRARRVIAKAEQISGKENPRYVVTSLTHAAARPQALYEEIYCARGEMENRIKEQMLLFADRMSAETMRANQLRLYLSAAAYLLVEGLRRLALQGTAMAQAQVNTIRLRLLKIGAQFRMSVRRIAISMASAYPYRATFAQAWAALRC
jgi:hypothetical protein